MFIAVRYNKTDIILFVGVVLISLALCADAAIGNVQEKTMKQYGASNTEVVSLTSCSSLHSSGL